MRIKMDGNVKRTLCAAHPQKDKRERFLWYTSSEQVQATGVSSR